jgi:DNA-directed RNA polymerase specialized sigma subunit
MTYATISDIVTTTTPEVLTEEAEAHLIRLAQTGDQEAVTALIAQYGPAFRKALRGLKDEALEDAEQEAALVFLEMIQSHDTAKSPRLAGRVSDALRRGVSTATNSVHGWDVPTRMVERFFAILKAADGSVAQGHRIASAHDMAPQTFLDIARAVGQTESIEALAERADAEGSTSADGGVFLTGGADDAYVMAEDRILVDGLLALLDERETPIIRYSYGFDSLPVTAEEAKEGNAKTREEGIAVANDSVVARHLGMTRATVQRTRSKALSTMREALTAE